MFSCTRDYDELSGESTKQSMETNYYISLLITLRSELARAGVENSVNPNLLVLLHDNLEHMAQQAVQILGQRGSEILPHPAELPDLVLSDSFPNLKQSPNRRRSRYKENAIKAIED